MEDKKIIKQILSGDQEAFRTLVESYQKLVAHVVFRMLPNQMDREDVCQEVFIKVYRSVASFKFKSKLSTWIAKIARNTCLNHLEKKKLPAFTEIADETRSIDDMPGDSLSPEFLSARSDIAELLRQEIVDLPPNYRIIVSLYHLEGMSYAEIGEITDLPEGTVKSHLFRGRKFLRDRILEKYEKEELVK